MRVIIKAKEGVSAAAALTLSDENREDLPLIDAVVADLPEDEVAELRAKGYEVFEDRTYRVPTPPSKGVTADAVYPSPECDPTTPGPMRQMIEAGVEDVLKTGHTGVGVHVGVADTGVDASHPDLLDAIVGYRDFTGGDSDTPQDPFGHGTGVCGVLAGRGLVTPKFHGVAPGAKISIARVLGADGSGSTSGIIRGLDWLVTQGVSIINMSLGSEETSYDALSMAVDAVAAKGILVIVAAGNDGPNTRVEAPANAERCIAVAACTQDDVHSDFSCPGPATGPGGKVLVDKPEIMAWGENVVMPLSSQSQPMGFRVGDHYQVADGTSFACPFVSGCAALYLETVGDLENFRQDIMDTAVKIEPYVKEQQGAGRIEVYEAICDGIGEATIPTETEPDDTEITPPTSSDLPASGCLLAVFGWLWGLISG